MGGAEEEWSRVPVESGTGAWRALEFHSSLLMPDGKCYFRHAQHAWPVLGPSLTLLPL